MDKPHVVGGVDLTRRYTPEDIVDMFGSGRLRAITDAGYCTQGRADGFLYFVPWHESNAFKAENNAWETRSFDADAMREDVEREHPMLRRTPQEKVAAMVMRLMADAKAGNGVPGLTEAQVKGITGQTWVSGEPMSETMIRSIAAHLLGIGEATNKEADSHRTTRLHALS